MAARPAASNRASTWALTCGLAAVAAALYAVTWQAAVHGIDWRWFVLWLEQPGTVHPQHPGYLVTAHALGLVLAPFEPSSFALLRVLSILGGAAAVAGCHRTATVAGLDGRGAVALALVAMCCPGLWHHATVVELHAPFLGIAAWAAVPVARWARHGALGDAVVAGVLTGLATLMHATGHLLVIVVLAVLLHRRWRRGAGALLRRMGAFVAAHAAAWGAGFALIRATGGLPDEVAGLAAESESLAAPDNPLDQLVRWSEDMDFIAQIGPTVVNEWLEPFAPLSVLVLGALGVRRLRAAAGWLLAVLALYLVVTVALVHSWTDERGAYLLPLLLPAGLLTLALLTSASLRALLLALTLAAGLVFRGEPGRLPPNPDFGAAAVAMAKERATIFLVADVPEMDGAFLADPRLSLELARKCWDELRAGQGASFEPTPPQVAGWLALLAQRARESGARFVITDRAVLWLRERVAAFGAGFDLFVHQSGARPLPAGTGIDGWVVG